MDHSVTMSSQQKLNALRSHYRQRLAEYKDQLESISFLSSSLTDQVDEVMAVAHRLAGSGKAFGFAELSQLAKELELVCDYARRLPSDRVASAIDTPLQELLSCLERDSCGKETAGAVDSSTADECAQPQDLSMINLLLIDDDPEFSSRLSEKLAMRGYHVHCLEDIEALPDIVRQVQPHAMLVDMDFYGRRLAGAEMVSLWRQHDGAPVPVIFISGFDSFEVRLAAVRAGGNHFLKKPLDEERLLYLLRSELSINPDDPYRVLLVDDDSDLLDLYKSTLAEAGYIVTTAESAEDALILMEQDQPELALIDVQMPGASGIELGRLIRQHETFSHIPLLFMSSSADTDIQLACARLANDEFFNKPIEPWRLLMIIKSRVARSRRLRGKRIHTLGYDPQGSLDALTALPGLKTFRHNLEQALRQVTSNTLLAVMKLDIRYFHTINNLYGHFKGDQVLQQMAWVLSEHVNTDDRVCRESGDEFYILTVGYDSIESIVQYAGTLVNAVEQDSTSAKASAIALSVDVGIAVATQEGESADGLLQSADTALFVAKQSPSSEIRIFDRSLQQQEASRFALAQSIRQAFQADQFIAAYQPVYTVSDNKLVGFEALARWQHPERGVLGPGEFIPLMEEQGLICELTEAMLTQALSQLACWQRVVPDLFMSINLSARDIQRPAFLQKLKSLIADFNLSPASIVLEITETVLLADWPQTARVVEELRELGVQLALDDFGTGYSSLSYLNRVHANKLKIDRSFIQNWSHSSDSRLLRTMVQLGQAMNMAVIAEGVEQIKELDLLRLLECDCYQGFLAARPMFADEIERDQWIPLIDDIK